MLPWFDWFVNAPRRVLVGIAIACACVLAAAVTLQLLDKLDPCPMCIVQRYAVILVGLSALVAAFFKGRSAAITGGVFVLLFAGFGAFVAARQSFLQWFPPEFSSCGRDFYGMIETFPLRRAIPMIFRGSGDCVKVDWTFLGGSLANWAFVFFAVVIVAALVLIARQWRARPVAAGIAPA